MDNCVVDEENLSESQLQPTTYSNNSTDNEVIIIETDDVDNYAFRVNNHQEDHHQHLEPLSLKEFIYASKEVAPYWVILIINDAFNEIVNTGTGNFFQSSSFTNAGMNSNEANVAGDNVQLVQNTMLFIFGLSVVTFIGKFLSTKSPYYLWLPTIVLITIVCTMFTGVTFGVYPPLPVPGVYMFYVSIFVCNEGVAIYAPIMLRNDAKRTTKRYHEFQLQSIEFMNFVACIIVDIISLCWLQTYVKQQCESNYESDYDLSCSALG